MVRRVPIALAATGALFYLAHAAELVAFHPASNLLWSCNVASLTLAIGLCLDRAAPVAVGCFLLSVGDVIWLLDLVAGGEPTWTAPLTHVGLFAIGLWAMKRLGLPRHAWWQSVALLSAAVLAARLAGPPEENINFAFSVPKGWSAYGVPMDMVPEALAPWAQSQAIFMIYIAALFASSALAQQRLLPHLGFPRATPAQGAPRD